MSKESPSKNLVVGMLFLVFIALAAVAGILGWQEFGGSEKLASDTAGEIDSDSSGTEQDPLSNQIISTDGDFSGAELDENKLGIKLFLKDYDYQISAVVPDEETKQNIQDWADQVMQGSGSTDLLVNPDVSSAPWTENLETLIKDFADSVTEGEMIITEEGSTISGIAPIPQFEEALLKTIQDGEYPELANNLEVKNLIPPTIKIVAQDGKVELSGAVPNEVIKEIMFRGTEELYGEGNVTNNFTIDDQFFAPYRYVRFARSLGVVKPFGNYEVGNKSGVVYAIIRENVNFDSGSDVLSPEFSKNISGLALYLNATASNGLVVEGHTDSDGNPEINNPLSQSRANNVKAILVEANVDPDRIKAIGKGQDEPIVDNDSEENKSRNRRVEIKILPVTEIN